MTSHNSDLGCPQQQTIRYANPASSSSVPVRLAILDRDGTLNVDTGYVHRVEELELMAWAGELCCALQDHNYTLVVASNQSGVGRGYFTNDQVRDFNLALAERLLLEGVAIAEFMWCPHLPTDNCVNRKPSPGLLSRLLSNWDAADALFVGNSKSDSEAAKAACLPYFSVGPSIGADLREFLNDCR